MPTKAIKLHREDDLVVALADLKRGERIQVNGDTYTVEDAVPAKQKFAARAFSPGDTVHMYGVVVGRAVELIRRGALITRKNITHATGAYEARGARAVWSPPDVSAWKEVTFRGYHRSDGKVGTANYWLVVPLVFCENRIILALRDAFLDELGYGRTWGSRSRVRELKELYEAGMTAEDILAHEFDPQPQETAASPLFPHVDGVKFLWHGTGCGGTREDARSLCGLLAGYIDHPNVAGATVLSLGCQNAQITTLEEELHRRNPRFDKPLYILEHQRVGRVSTLLDQAIKHTFAGLVEADKCRRDPAPLSAFVVGVECGGSDGFSGLSANPAIGFCSDLVVAAGGTVILSEFPELCGVEQELCDRCAGEGVAERFVSLMRAYDDRAKAVGSGFDANPTAGNIRDGLMTDAMKSAGAARKGGTSPVTDVLDYPEPVTRPGLNLLCTPGNDVESTTAMAGSGATLMLFSTGSGTPTGNPVAPVIKVSSNTPLYEKMGDIIDVDAGRIIAGEESIQSVGTRLFERCIQTASGEYTPKAVQMEQDDFLPWKRDVSL